MDGLVFYAKARAFKAKPTSSPRPDSLKAKAKKFGFKAKAKD